MKIKYLAHSAFLVVSSEGTRILIDPYHLFEGFNHAPIDETADVVLVTHEHPDHNNAEAVKGSPKVFKGGGKWSAKEIEFTGVSFYHDEHEGAERGTNTVFCFTVDGVRLCHTGDLGHTLSADQASALGKVDMLFIPVGGAFTVDAAGATSVAEQIGPRVTIPMHYKTADVEIPIAGVDDFLSEKNNVRKFQTSEVELSAETLPAGSEIWVLNNAL